MYQNNSQYDELIKQAGSQTGLNPEKIKQTVDSGKLDDLLKKLRPADAQKFNEILNDPKKAEAMLKTPQAQMLIKQFMK